MTVLTDAFSLLSRRMIIIKEYSELVYKQLGSRKYYIVVGFFIIIWNIWSMQIIIIRYQDSLICEELFTDRT